MSDSAENETGPDSTASSETHAGGTNPQDGTAKADAYDACIMCDKKATLRCPTCGTWYCCRRCYRQDWPDHKILCNSLKGKYSDSERPPNRIRAIFFPLHEPHPTFLWVDKEDIEPEVCIALGAKSFGDVCVYDHVGARRLARKRKNTDKFWVFALAKETQIINRSILSMAKPGHQRLVLSPLVFLTWKASHGNYVDYIDASLRDYRDILDSCRHGVEIPCVTDPVRFPLEIYDRKGREAKFWPAIKLNCLGDIARLSPFCGEGKTLDLAENVLVLPDYIVAARLPCFLPRLAELPWVMEYCKANNSSLSDDDLYNYGGRVFAPGGLGDGAVNNEPLPTTHCGTINVMHEKGAPIHHSHVLCFYDFAEAQLRRLTMTKSSELGTYKVSASLALMKERINKERFMEYWHDWIMEKMKDAKHPLEYKEICSPYDFEDLEAERKYLEEAMRGLEVDSKKEHEKALAVAKKDLGIVD